MSVLSGPEILMTINRTRLAREAKSDIVILPAIDIEPLDESLIGPNSVDLRLGPKLLVYGRQDERGCLVPPDYWEPLDCRESYPTYEFTIGEGGMVLYPGTLYLGSTLERTTCQGIVPCIETRSSVARLGISTHRSAGFGDDNFSGTWTLEIEVIHPVRVYAGMRICQIAFTTLLGERKPYKGKYGGQSGPIASKLHLDGGKT